MSTKVAGEATFEQKEKPIEFSSYRLYINALMILFISLD